MRCLEKIKNKLERAALKKYTKNKLNGATIGNDVTVMPKLRVRNPKYIVVGDSCYFGRNCRIEAWDKYLDDDFTPKIIFGKDVRINSTCHIGCINKIEIGDQTLLGSHVMIIDHSHGRNNADELALHPSERRLYSKGEVRIGKRCWICENAVILPGVHIGDETTIAANAVVTKDIPSRCVAAGNPAKVVKFL